MSIVINEDFIRDRSWHEVILLLQILLNADEDHEYRTSLRKLSSETGIGVHELRNLINKIEREGTITSQIGAQFGAQYRAQGKTCITINDTTYYDIKKKSKGTKSGTVSGTKSGTVSGTEIQANSVTTKSKESDIDYHALKVYFNQKVEGTPIPTIEKIDDKRRASVRARALTYGKASIKTVIDNAVTSDYLTGKVKDWCANFDWIFGVKNFPKVLEGNYVNRNRNEGFGKPGSAQRLSELERVVSALEGGADPYSVI